MGYCSIKNTWVAELVYALVLNTNGHCPYGFNSRPKYKMKKVMITLVAVTMFACSPSTTETTTTSCDSTCNDSICVDSIGVRQIMQMDSLHKEGKL